MISLELLQNVWNLKICKALTGSLVCYCSRHFTVAETPMTVVGLGNASLQFLASKRLWDASAGKAVFLVSIITHSASICRNKHSREEKIPISFNCSLWSCIVCIIMSYPPDSLPWSFKSLPRSLGLRGTEAVRDTHYSGVLHVGNRACVYALGNPEAKIL